MPRKKFQQSKIQESDVTGLKYFDQLSPMLQRLHDDGCQRETANNRELHYDQYCMLILLYAFDRGSAKFELFNKVAASGSSYVCRLRDNAVWQEVEQHSAHSDAQQAEVGDILSDQTVKMGSNKSRVDHPVRVICVKCNPHTTRGRYRSGSSGVDSDGVLRIATNLLDVPAEIIALIFSHRWAIEIFFRFFKHMLGCRHLLSRNQNGIEIQTYCAIIACLLISLWTGKKPTLRTYEMICFYLCGMADEDELIHHIKKLHPQPA